MNKQAIKALIKTFEQSDSDPGSKADAHLYVRDMLTLMRALLDEDKPEPDTPWFTKLPDDAPVECKTPDGWWSMYYAQGDHASVYRDGTEPWKWSDFTDVRMPEQPSWGHNADYVAVYDAGDAYPTDYPEEYPVGENGVLHIYKRSDHE